MSKGKMHPVGLNEAMVYVVTSWCLASDHRPSVWNVPLGRFCHESKAHDCLWLGRSGKGGLIFTEWIGGLIAQNPWVSCPWPCFEMKKLSFHHSSDIRLMRGTKLQSLFQ